MNVHLPPEPVPGFLIALTLGGNSCKIKCSGVLDGPDATTHLQPHLLSLHEALLEHKVKLVQLDLSTVEYMNSSGIKCFMAWFLKADRAKETAYQIEIMFDAKRTWQYVSFTTMGRIAPKVLKTVTSPVAAAP
jgi:hypothetical protein